MGMEGFGAPKFNKQETAANPEQEWESKLDSAQNREELIAAIEQVPGGMLNAAQGGAYEASGLIEDMRRTRDIGPAERSGVRAIENAAKRIRRQETEEYMRKIREGK